MMVVLVYRFAISIIMVACLHNLASCVSMTTDWDSDCDWRPGMLFKHVGGKGIEGPHTTNFSLQPLIREGRQANILSLCNFAVFMFTVGTIYHLAPFDSLATFASVSSYDCFRDGGTQTLPFPKSRLWGYPLIISTEWSFSKSPNIWRSCQSTFFPFAVSMLPPSRLEKRLNALIARQDLLDVKTQMSRLLAHRPHELYVQGYTFRYIRNIISRIPMAEGQRTRTVDNVLSLAPKESNGDQLIVLLNALSLIPPSIRQEVVNEALHCIYQNHMMDVYKRSHVLSSIFTEKVS
jgi:hypothetical protein